MINRDRILEIRINLDKVSWLCAFPVKLLGVVPNSRIIRLVTKEEIGYQIVYQLLLETANMDNCSLPEGLIEGSSRAFWEYAQEKLISMHAVGRILIRSIFTYR